MKITNILLALVLLCQCAWAQTTITGSKLDKINTFLSFFPEDEPGGTLLIAQNGQTLYKNAFGIANLELDVPMNTENVIGIASVTKPFTAIAILKLTEDGKISLEDPLSKFITDFSNGNTIMIKHLISHTSGLPYFSLAERTELERGLQLKKKGDPISISSFFMGKKFRFSPGEAYAYSNEAYILLGYIIENITEISYEQFLKEVFFEPLQMKSTQLESVSKVIKNRATGYDSFNNAQYRIKQQQQDDVSYSSAGGLMSTVNDLSIWYSAIMKNEILKKSTLSKALTPIRFNNGNVGTNGLGWFLGNLNGHKYITHDGLGWGYGAVVIYFPEEDLFIAHLRNCGYCQYNRDLSYQAPIKIASILLDSEFQDIHENKNSINYTGIYISNLSEDKTIITLGSHSYLKRGDNYIPLKFIKEHTYFSISTNETIVFSKNGLTSSIGTTIHFEKSKSEPKVPLSLFLINNMKDIKKEEIVSLGLDMITNENFEVNESSINNLGYSYIQKRNLVYAIEIFRLNTILFPNSSNAFDSLAEAHYYKENYDEALKNYTKALKLNPENYNAVSMLEKIKSKNN